MWCDFHTRRWEHAGKPDPEQWLSSCRGYGRPRYSVVDVPEPARSELQYVLQCRHDENRSRLKPWAFNRLGVITVERHVASLLDLPENEVVGGVNGYTRTLLRWSQDRLQQLVVANDDAHGLDSDVWNLRHLGSEPHASRGTAIVRFDGISQSWLRMVVKRWVRLKLVAGFAGGSIQNHARVMTRFSAWVTDHAPLVVGFGDIDRLVLEDWLAGLHLEPGLGLGQKNAAISALRSLLDDCRRHGWTPDLPMTAALYRSDLLREPDLLPRALPEHVIRQLETEDALRTVGDSTCEVIVRVLIDTGLRISHVLGLPIDALHQDPAGHWCLHILDTKVRREHVLPLTDALAEHLLRQRDNVRQQWPSGTDLKLFPRVTGNPLGQRSYAYGTFRDRLNDWLTRCDVRDEHGQRVHVTTHQFRHTLGTRMINNGVPQPVVQEWLNHRSPQMTAHYARLRHDTMRREWQAYRDRITITGDIVVLDPDAPATQAEWMKHNIHTASESLPNGYCGRPLQRECEVPNACLTCTDFLTDVSFLPIHEEQHAATLALIKSAEGSGHRRMVQTNRRVLASLDNIISGLRQLQHKDSGHAPN